MATTTKKVTPVKVSLAFVKTTPNALYTFGESVYAGMNTNPVTHNRLSICRL